MAQAKERILALVFASSLLVMGGCASTPEGETDQGATEVEAAPAPVAASSNDTYTVVRGDHLWGIASMSRIYGNPYQWPLIYKANSDKIADADLIRPGQVFDIERGASASDIDAAVRHAKTRGAWSVGVTEDSDKAYLRR